MPACSSANNSTGSGKKGFFTKFAATTARISGCAPTFGVAVSIILVWAVTGPLFKFSDTWQLVINTGTTIVTFLMVFLIQNTQNRDSEALHLKIDELIRATRGAKNQLLALEDLSQEDLDTIKKEFIALASDAEEAKEKVKTATAKSRESSASHKKGATTKSASGKKK